MSEKLNEQMVMGTEAFDCGVQKRLVHAGLKPIDYFDGTKVRKFYLMISQKALNANFYTKKPRFISIIKQLILMRIQLQMIVKR